MNAQILKRQKALYTDEELKHFLESASMKKYVTKKASASEVTASTYKTRLAIFAQYIFQKYDKQPVDGFVEEIKEGKRDPYDVMSDFVVFIQETRKGKFKLEPSTLSGIVRTVRRFLRSSGVKSITTEDFNEQVSLPRKLHKEKVSLDRQTIAQIFNACRNMRLKTAAMLIACTGPRAMEGMAVRVKDLKLDGEIPTVTFRAEYSKMRKERTRYLTRECAAQLRLWLKKKYGARWTSVMIEGRKKNVYVDQKPNPDDLIFAGWRYEDGKNTTSPDPIYDQISGQFAQAIESVGLGDFEENGNRRKITLNSFRHFVKSQISDLGYADYSEWFIGHAGSTYYDRPEKDKRALYQKIEPYLTFLDVAGLEAKGADQGTQIDQLRVDLQKERERTANLYDQLYKQGLIKKE